MLCSKLRPVILFCSLLAAFHILLSAQEPLAKKNPDTPTGAELYARHCAVCHGSDLKGTGPVPPPYRKPPDLTKLARRHDGKFPEAYVAKVLRNGVTLPSHGPAEMPIWGPDLAGREQPDGPEAAARIRRLVAYIKSLQEK